MDIDSKTFMVYVAIREQKKIPMHFEKPVQVRALLFDKASTEIPAEYSDYNDVFLVENIVEFLENTRINKHAIK